MCGVYIVDCEELSNLRNTKFSSVMNNFNIISEIELLVIQQTFWLNSCR